MDNFKQQLLFSINEIEVIRCDREKLLTIILGRFVFKCKIVE